MEGNTKMEIFINYQKDDVPDASNKGKFLLNSSIKVDEHGMIQVQDIVDMLTQKAAEKKCDEVEGELCIWMPSCRMWMNLGPLEQARHERIKKFDFDQVGSEAGGVSVWMKTKKSEGNEFEDTYDELVYKLGDKKKRRIKDVIRIIAIWLKCAEKEKREKNRLKEEIMAKREAQKKEMRNNRLAVAEKVCELGKEPKLTAGEKSSDSGSKCEISGKIFCL